MTKNAQTTAQLNSFHMLASLCSKSFKLGFGNMWTKKFWMYKLGFEEAEETDQIANIRRIIEKIRESQKNIYFCFIDYTKTFVCVDHNKLWQSLYEMGVPDHFTCFLRNLYAGQTAVKIRHGTTQFSSVQLLSHVRLFATPWTTVR